MASWVFRSAEKFVPDEVFGLREEQIARFLGVMYACDGHVYCSDRLAQIGYTTISERLARDVQHLLLRLGIVATIRALKRPVYDGTGKVAREIRITSQAACGGSAGWSGCRARKRDGTRSERLARSRAGRTPTSPWQYLGGRSLCKGGAQMGPGQRGSNGRPRNHNWHVGGRAPSAGWWRSWRRPPPLPC